ncbi:hypothetical protein PIB30_118676 [Stylosanthes scabra]|uniref:DUF7755 domain-containing protein n=1 Tax=Stylosanthes scabra TaxID=79078 RepID=A0ABU6S410_9FABA|nr:hypothetical protein [Stylosanthes scabra]
MEGIPLRTTMPSTSTAHTHNHAFHSIKTRSTSTLLHLRRIRPLRFAIRAKISETDFQDFQRYARPLNLLPASEVKVCTNTLIEKISSSLKDDKAKSLFRVKLGTSNAYGSSLSDPNAGILLCLIDEHGNSILQRIPAYSMIGRSMESDDTNNTDMLHFQRGSIDEFIFEGPKVAKIEALWVSLESGQVNGV